MESAIVTSGCNHPESEKYVLKQTMNHGASDTAPFHLKKNHRDWMTRSNNGNKNNNNNLSIRNEILIQIIKMKY